MPFMNDSYFCWYNTLQGALLTYPAQIDGYHTAQQVLDPVTYNLLDFMKAVLNIHLGSAWLKTATQINKSSIPVVSQTIPYNPIPYLQDTYITFPNLSMWQVSSNVDQFRGVDYLSDHRTYQIAYILPPLKASENHIFGVPMLNAIRDILIYRLFDTTDSNYQNGVQVGQLSGFDELKIISTEMTDIEIPGNQLPMHAIVINCEIVVQSKGSVLNFPNSTIDSGAGNFDNR